MAIKDKQKTEYSCANCGIRQMRWTGQCPKCLEWNTFHEEIRFVEKFDAKKSRLSEKPKPIRLKEVTLKETVRFETDIKEFDRMIGGGIVPGSLVLVGGEPGIGKSTLMLQLSAKIARKGKTVLYVTGEESVEQTTIRARRLGIDEEGLFLLAETNFNHILQEIDAINPDVLIVDSVQVIYKAEIPSAPGSVTQVRETTQELMLLSKGRTITTFIIGHVTKGGDIAGPKVLEHLVDTVLYFEGDKQNNFRMIKVVKNRFGPTDEVAVFQMLRGGLAEVPNPSELFLAERVLEVPGAAVASALEGNRPILIEAQALVSETNFPAPTRRSSGIDQNRLALLLAVLEKKVRYPLYRCDVFVSVAGGMKIVEPGLDLSLSLAVASSFRNKPIDRNTCMAGEIGLSGEVRPVARIESRIKEAKHMGFKRIILPKRNVKGLSKEAREGIAITGVDFIEEAIDAVIG